jgi:hypothetical protein
MEKQAITIFSRTSIYPFHHRRKLVIPGTVEKNHRFDCFLGVCFFDHTLARQWFEPLKANNGLHPCSVWAVEPVPCGLLPRWAEQN